MKPYTDADPDYYQKLPLVPNPQYATKAELEEALAGKLDINNNAIPPVTLVELAQDKSWLVIPYQTEISNVGGLTITQGPLTVENAPVVAHGLVINNAMYEPMTWEFDVDDGQGGTMTVAFYFLVAPVENYNTRSAKTLDGETKAAAAPAGTDAVDGPEPEASEPEADER